MLQLPGRHKYKAILANILEGRITFGQIMKLLITNSETAKAKTDPKMVKKMMEDILSSPLEARNHGSVDRI